MARAVAIIFALFMLGVLLALPPPASAQGPSVSVLADFGDGTYRWADVTLPISNTTALKATELANASWDLPPVEVTWFDSPFCVRRPCAFVDDLGDRNPVYPVWWHFYVWSATTEAWELGLGPSDTDLVDGDAIAWYLAVDDPNTFASPRPVPTPAFREVQTSFRGDLQNSGRAHGTIPVTNALLWETDVGVLEIDTTPVVAYGMVFVATRNALVALDAETGDQVWRDPQVRSLLSTPAIYNGHLVLGGTGGRLHYVDAFTGTEEWSVLLEPGAVSTGIASSPAVHEGRAYVGTFNETAAGKGRVAAVNLNNGTVAWTFETASVHLSQPAIVDGVLYVGVMGIYDGDIGFGPPHGLLALGLEGTERWFFPTGGPVAASPVVADGLLAFPAKDGFLHALRPEGTQAWRRAIGVSTSSPSLVGDRLYVGSGGFSGSGALFAFDLQGNQLWTQETPGAVQASLVSDGRLVCAATNVLEGRHVCYRASDGAPVWSFTPLPRNFILGSPVVVGDTMFTVSDNGRVYAYRDRDSASTPLLKLARTFAPTPSLNASEGFVAFAVESLNRSRAAEVQFTLQLPEGFRLVDETAEEARVTRTKVLDLGELEPGRTERLVFVFEEPQKRNSFVLVATLTYTDVAGRTYPTIELSETVTTGAALSGNPWPLVGAAAAVAAAAVVAVLVWRRWKRGEPRG